MKLIALEASGIKGTAEETFDFSAQLSNLTVIANGENVKEYLVAGFFGGKEKGTIRLVYEIEGETFVIERDFESGFARMSTKDGEPICEKEEIEGVVARQCGLDGKSFELLTQIDRDSVVENFFASKEIRNEYIQGLLDSVLPDRDDVVKNEEKVKQEFDTLGIKEEILGVVPSGAITELKNEITFDEKARAIAKDEIASLAAAIEKGASAEKALAEKAVLAGELEKLNGKAFDVENAKARLAKAEKAVAIKALFTGKAKIEEENAALAKEIAEDDAVLAEKDGILAKGEKTKTEMQNTVLHCMARLEELRKILYGKVKEYSTDDYSATLRTVIDGYYADEEKQIALLSTRKKEIETEYEATLAAYKELTEKYASTAFPQERRHAIREGAVLEMAMEKTSVQINEAHDCIEFANARCREIEPQIKELKESLASGQTTLTNMRNSLLRGYKSKEESINASVVEKQTLAQNQIFVITQEKEIDAIDKKIELNVKAVNSYLEDKAALDSAKSGLEAYIAKVREKLAAMEAEMLETKSQWMYARSLNAVEYGEKCPVCNHVVLDKAKSDDEKKLAAKLAKIELEIDKGRKVLDEYDQKYIKVVERIGELAAKVATSTAYLESLRASVLTRKNLIKKIIDGAKVRDSAQLTEKLNAAIATSNGLLNLSIEIGEIETALRLKSNTLTLLEEEKKRLEEEELPRYNLRFSNLSEELGAYKNSYEKFVPFFNEGKAFALFEELTVAEKEMDTFERGIAEKREKMLALSAEKEQLTDVLLIMSNRNKKVVLEGEECDYIKVVAKVLTAEVREIIDEIGKSEEELDDIKTEFSAVRRVIARTETEKKEIEEKLLALTTKKTSNETVLGEMLANYDESVKELGVTDEKAIDGIVLTAENKEKLISEVSEYSDRKAVLESAIARCDAEATENAAELNALEANRKAKVDKEAQVEELSKKLAASAAKLSDYKTSSKQVSELKAQREKKKDKLKFFGEIKGVIDNNDTFAKYVVKLANKKISNLSAGKYGLAINNDELQLINASKNGAVTEKKSFSAEENLLVALALGSSVNNVLTDVFDAEELSLLFAVEPKETDKVCAKVLLNYAKREGLVALTADKSLNNSLKKIVL